ncbi:ATP dependent RNA helicase [Candidatus Thiodiazotropha sp. CDECU1]|uniref:ATP dependent RNA helicase n=1 Tax=Candidatus Thiodiazotropha sp. CDECU1 TaxID=3065865 RepID=UPI00292CD067|nr:ATP dependent RNA helicase [Candidatus Thiodiazotropha sp. CDECU1]
MAAMKVESLLDIYLQIDAEILLSRIGFLIWRYQISRSRRMACAVVRHIEALCHHPEFDSSTTPYCGYHRSLNHWRLLAGETHALVETA